MGVKGTALDWFISYPSERTQYVRVGNSTSGKTTLKFGVPQGSVGRSIALSSLFATDQHDIHKTSWKVPLLC